MKSRKKKRNRFLTILSLCLFSALIFCGCKKEEEETIFEVTKETEETVETQAEEETEEEVEEEEEEEETDDLPEGYMYSYLTGLPVTVEEGSVRPIAVMMNNIEDAIPQSGIAQADIIYEAPAEGGINRLMPIFSSVEGLDKIGSIRSTRTYFIYYAAEFQSILVHAGAPSYADLHLETIFCDNINALESVTGNYFYRTDDRPSPHNLYIDEDGLFSAISYKAYYTEYHDYAGEYPYDGTYQFDHSEEGVTLSDGLDALTVIPGYPLNEPWFEYDEESGEYLRFQYGKPHTDEDGTELSVKNILIVSTPCDPYYDTEYLDFHVEDGGDGYFITNGKAVPVTWEKDWEWGITHYYDDSGEEIKLNPGKTWVCIVQESQFEKVQIIGEEE